MIHWVIDALVFVLLGGWLGALSEEFPRIKTVLLVTYLLLFLVWISKTKITFLPIFLVNVNADFKSLILLVVGVVNFMIGEWISR